MQRRIPLLVVIVTVAALLAVVSCSSSDEPTSIPPEQAVQSGMNSALNSTVAPLFTFYGALGQLFTVPAIATPGGYACPDTSGWCASGSASCALGQTGLDFTFDQCQVVTGDGPVTVSGAVSAIPGTTIYLTFTNLVLSGSPAITGNGSVNLGSCTYVADVQTNNAGISGVVTQCDTDSYPTGQTLYISLGDYLVLVTFDGSATATATATKGGLPAAYCTVDLSADPLHSTCSAP